LTVTSRAAAASEIREIVGTLDDRVIAGIFALGATREKILEAQSWPTSDDYLHHELPHALQGRAAEVFDVIEAGLPEPDRP
jgi:hypothetical protein